MGPNASSSTSLNVRVSSAMRRVLALSLLACFSVFVATIEIERKTLDPNTVQKDLERAGVLMPLTDWNIELYDCPSISINESCTKGPSRRGQFPLDWPESSAFSKEAKGFAIARAEHALTDAQKNWLLDKANASLVMPRNVHNATRTPENSVPNSVGIGTATEVVLDVKSVVQKEKVEIEIDFSGLPMFGPRDIGIALLDGDSVGTYQSLPARQLASSHLAMQLGIGFPLFIAVLAIVLDHSTAFALLSLLGIFRSLRSFLPFWYENMQETITQFDPIILLEPAFFILNGLCFSVFVLLAMELARLPRLTKKVTLIITASLTTAFLALGYSIPNAWLVNDLYADMGMGVFGVVAVGASLYFVWKERVGIIKEDQFSFKDTKWNFVALFLFALSCVLMTLVNAEDFWATLQGKVKTIIDWRHIAVFPAMTAAALFEVGFTSKKVLSVANEMTEKALIDKELQTAQEFQRQTLPPMRFENDLWRWRAVYKSASKLGGDWFDVREITFPNGKRMLVIGLVDVTGHGVGAAMVTTIVAAIWGLWCKDMSTKNTPESPEDNVAFLKEACGRLQEALSASRKEASGTGAFALLCAETQTLTYCTVGHPAIVVTNNKTISSLVTGNAAFGHATQGQERDWKIENKKISPEEKVIFYSDGIVPAESDASGFVQGFRRRLKKETLNVPTEFFQALRKARQSFRQNRDIEDDVTALVVGLK